MNWKRNVAVMLTVAMVVVTSACTYDIHTVATPDPTTLGKKAVVNGLTVAADPLFPASKSKAIFNTDLGDDGILAIHLIFSNNSQAEYLVAKENIGLVDKDGTRWLPIDAQEAAKSAHTNPALTGLATGIPMFFVFFSGVLVGPAVAWQTAKMNENITADFRAKEFKDKKLLAGETYGGFLFFRKPGPNKEIKGIEGLRLEAQVENLSTRQKHTAATGL